MMNFYRPYTAKQIAAALRKQGIAVRSATEGDASVDGEIEITDALSVQVPTWGGPPNVVLETADGRFQFFPERLSLTALLADIRKHA